MIVAEQKNIEEIKEMIAPYEKILIVGCGACVSFCSAGGAREVDALAETIAAERKEEGRGVKIETATVPRQCSVNFVERIEKKTEQAETILSMGCGVGVQTIAKRFPQKRVLPALNTRFIGAREAEGVWTEMCMACGDCILWRTAGICPVARCAKGLINGPCGGSSNGRCEVSKDIPCAWQEIYHGLKRLNLLRYLKEETPRHKVFIHPDRVVRADLQQQQAT